MGVPQQEYNENAKSQKKGCSSGGKELQNVLLYQLIGSFGLLLPTCLDESHGMLLFTIEYVCMHKDDNLVMHAVYVGMLASSGRRWVATYTKTSLHSLPLPLYQWMGEEEAAVLSFLRFVMDSSATLLEHSAVINDNDDPGL